MKKIIITLSVVLILALSSCSSDATDEKIPDEFPDSLWGTWNIKPSAISGVAKSYSINQYMMRESIEDGPTFIYELMNITSLVKTDELGNSWMIETIPHNKVPTDRREYIILHLRNDSPGGLTLRINDREHTYRK